MGDSHAFLLYVILAGVIIAFIAVIAAIDTILTLGKLVHPGKRVKIRPWWTAIFYLTLVWGTIGLAGYWSLPGKTEETIVVKPVVSNPAPDSAVFPLVQEAVPVKSLERKVIAPDENTVTYTQDPEILGRGRKVYMEHCAVCHAADGGGIVGPNLTDPFWLHGGSVRNIFWVIKYGIPYKGMISWQPILTPSSIRDVSVFIMSLQGTRPLNPRTPEGERYDENKPVPFPGKQEPELQRAENIRVKTDSAGDQIHEGRELFSGVRKLQGGGPPCITCHNVTEDIVPGGALIAPDLTNVYSRLEEAKIISLMTQPKYTSMQGAYDEHPITGQEAARLVSFFRFVGTTSAHQQERDERASGFLNRIKKNLQPATAP
jgi:mono/diheme cytochrome c family protein